MDTTKFRNKLLNFKEKLENSDNHFKKISQAKKKAKSSLEGNWWNSAVVTLLSLLLSAVTVFLVSIVFSFTVIFLGLAYPTEETVATQNTEQVSNIENITQEVTQETSTENTLAENSSTTETLSESENIEVPSDYYIAYYIAYFIFVIILFITVYPFYNTIISTILAVDKEEEKLLFTTNFKKGATHFKKFSSVLLYKLVKYIPAVLLINFSYVTYVLGIYFTFLINDNWIILVLASLVVTIIGFFIMLSVFFNYTFTPFIVFKEPEMDSNNILRKSKLIMYKNKRLYFDFIFSFIGWAILSILTFGVGFLWLIPYYELSKYYLFEDFKSPENMKNKESKKVKKESKKKIKKDDTPKDVTNKKNNTKNSKKKKKSK